MPILLVPLVLGFWALAYRAGRSKADRERVDEDVRPQTPVQGSLCMGCFEVHNQGRVGLATFEQAIEIGRAYPDAKFRRIG